MQLQEDVQGWHRFSWIIESYRSRASENLLYGAIKIIRGISIYDVASEVNKLMQSLIRPAIVIWFVVTETEGAINQNPTIMAQQKIPSFLDPSCRPTSSSVDESPLTLRCNLAPGSSPPRRNTNGFVVVFRQQQKNDDVHVLIQLRSESMPVMPGHFGVPGGMHDASDRDSLDAAVRETLEEAGLDLAPATLTKFASGGKCDWFCAVVTAGSVAPGGGGGSAGSTIAGGGPPRGGVEVPPVLEMTGYPRDMHELGDTDWFTDWRPDLKCEIPGHLWVPLRDVKRLKAWNHGRIMSGLEARIAAAARAMNFAESV